MHVYLFSSFHQFPEKIPDDNNYFCKFYLQNTLWLDDTEDLYW